ncbi:4-(cytidine 5'-diphospho)-2-C-methyl-D-erythritol kinase [Bifidobacterium olomucense]|uniref:4-diphosphocytidyl-2-C-methyl-D-erythritol kinase n=1 Tax=Bifidobacterium olomucense TaxID=2675324 RepID=A0A7Y0EZG7_9BIFI|nr:4-(cytidine 5'-diphospho)-2-C-methyl-D-erythritol kinase [Bifidobacterium sp. DSM 109959]NMM99246.1 4-diphosphocytidyl-2C-methyl-D-erythritol kinase [Bifidobacterium sp. DSM 109959]
MSAISPTLVRHRASDAAAIAATAVNTANTASASDTLHASNATPLTVSVDCPAKTNLVLHVGPTHEEWGGRHELDTIYCAVGVYDTVTATAKQPGAGFSLAIEGAYLGDLASSSADMRRNHAALALFAMAEAAGREPDVALTITKRIPVGAGLGGGSADAAATLLAVNRLWDLNWPVARLRAIAATLGADMPFCVTGGIARGTGFGERITDITPDSEQGLRLAQEGFAGQVLVGAYQSQLSTPEVYHTFDVVGAGAQDANHLQASAVSLHPRSGQAIEAATAAGARHAFVSGSGPSVVAFVPDDTVADQVITAWRDEALVDRIIRAIAPAKPSIGVSH